MGVMGTAVKVLIGLVLVLPMTAYVVGSLVAAADTPQPHQPIIVQAPTKTPDKPAPSPSGKPTEKPGHDKNDDHGGKGKGNDDPGTVIVTPSPSDLFDDNGGLEDNSGKGSGGGDDDSSGSGSGHG